MKVNRVVVHTSQFPHLHSIWLMNTLLPYDCECVSHVLSCYSVIALKMFGCHIGNKGAELLVKHYPTSTGQLLRGIKPHEK